jgi:hypothetical protein
MAERGWQSEILEIVRQDGAATIAGLAGRLAVSG